MKMKRAWIFALTCVMLLILNGCSAQNVTRGQADGEAYDAVVSVKGRKEMSDSGENSRNAESLEETAEEKHTLSVGSGDKTALEELEEQLMGLTKLVGKEDEAAAGLLGGGAENRTEDGAVLVGRIYQTMLFGQKCSVYTGYDEADLVSVVVAELPGSDAAEYEAMFTALFGSASIAEEEESGERSRYWENGGYRFTLYESDGALSLDVNWAAFE